MNDSEEPARRIARVPLIDGGLSPPEPTSTRTGREHGARQRAGSCEGGCQAPRARRLRSCYTRRVTTKDVIRHWRKGAKNALRAAVLTQEDGEQELALFHCHLAAEKALKAVIMEKTGKPHPKIHTLGRLALLLREDWSAEERELFDALASRRAARSGLGVPQVRWPSRRSQRAALLTVAGGPAIQVRGRACSSRRWDGCAPGDRGRPRKLPLRTEAVTISRRCWWYGTRPAETPCRTF